ncbi:hypothetical protein PF003_g23728 [Phytophthora fragariae]|nr:hypothetical protein PF003_g23728 [Phytophthora fragariae]
MGTWAAERSDGGTPLAEKLTSVAKAAPPVVIAGPKGPPFIGLTSIALRVVQRADEASGTGA